MIKRGGMISLNNAKEQFEKLQNVSKRFVTSIVAVILLLILVIFAFRIATNYIWMDSLDFASIYTTILYSKATIGVTGFILFFLLTYVTLYFIRYSYMKHFDTAQLPQVVSKNKYAQAIMILASIVIGMIGSMIIQSIGWEPVLKFLHFEKFGVTDPYFGKDVSFYMFVLPFLQFIIYTLLNAFIFYLIIQLVAYSVFNMYRMSKPARIHLASTIGIIGLLLASIHLLGRYTTVLSNQVNLFQTSVVHGLSYTDQLVNIPKAYVLGIAVIVLTVWIVIALFRGKIFSALRPLVLYIGLFIFAQVASIIVQNFVVSPNEFAKEKVYLEHNLNLTKQAYALDEIDVKENPGNISLDEKMVKRNKLTIDNVRLNDSRPLLDIYNQLQTFRTYYQFNDIDIDRYEIDGKYEQVFIGARELSTKDLPEQAQTWVNKNLRYTHGYGIAMSHVNKVTNQGQPQYMMKNIPSEGDIDIKRPQIYFGEEKYPNVIVNSKVDEFDYPTGEENATNRYEEDAGIPLTTMNRLLFAIKEGSFRLFVSDQITSESKFLETRNIKDRVKRIAPFLTYDEDPYIIIREDGTLAWIIDAYVQGANYPYSEAYNGSTNYIRNSVKVVIDAYTGEVDFYLVEPDEPLVKTYQKIFPDLFTTDIPEDVASHFRYPVDLFKIQASMYGTYHMSNLEVFYNREDFWQFPTEKYFNQDIEMDPYYITMKLPENDEEEFVLMLPYTPKNRQNMISWMGVRNDGDHYGEMFVYRFPKQKNIYGPQQIENRINQDSHISQQLNLWSQGGSEVIRGNLLVIPIEDTVLYVEPVYIESSNETSLPEVKQVIMAYDDYIVMEETFAKSLEKILDLVESGAAPPSNAGDAEGVESLDDEEATDDSADEKVEEELPILDAEESLQEISTLFEQYQKALSDGDWIKAGELMEQIEAYLPKN